MSRLAQIGQRADASPEGAAGQGPSLPSQRRVTDGAHPPADVESYIAYVREEGAAARAALRAHDRACLQRAALACHDALVRDLTERAVARLRWRGYWTGRVA